MAVHWYVQEGSFPDSGGVQRLIYAVAEAGGAVRVEPYTRGGAMDFNLLPQGEPGLFFGSINKLEVGRCVLHGYPSRKSAKELPVYRPSNSNWPRDGSGFWKLRAEGRWISKPVLNACRLRIQERLS